MSARVSWYSCTKEKWKSKLSLNQEQSHAEVTFSDVGSMTLFCYLLQCFEVNFPFHGNSVLYRGNKNAITPSSEWTGILFL